MKIPEPQTMMKTNRSNEKNPSLVTLVMVQNQKGCKELYNSPTPVQYNDRNDNAGGIRMVQRVMQNRRTNHQYII